MWGNTFSQECVHICEVGVRVTAVGDVIVGQCANHGLRYSRIWKKQVSIRIVAKNIIWKKKETRTVSQIALLIISLEVFWTRIIRLYTATL